jgi:hypothetical protein
MSCIVQCCLLKIFIGKNSQLMRKPYEGKRLQPPQSYNVHSSIQTRIHQIQRGKGLDYKFQ